MSNSYEQKGFYSYMTSRSGIRELSESRYNLTIGATLTWGFFLNYLLLQFAAPALLSRLYASPSGYSGFMIFFLIGYFALVMIGNSMVRSYDPVRCFLGYNLIAASLLRLPQRATTRP